MCVYSMVMDDFTPWVPKVVPYIPPTIQPYVPPTQEEAAAQLRKFQELIDGLRKAGEKAKQEDAQSGAPDCTDPEKAKLMDRVAELEKIIANPPEFVLVKGANLKPGKYRVIDGKLYKVVE
jgi:hypothetical protein